MPIYEFKCKKCGKTFEQLMFPSDPEDAAVCPSCGQKGARKLMSSFSRSASGSGAGSGVSSQSCVSHGGFS